MQVDLYKLEQRKYFQGNVDIGLENPNILVKLEGCDLFLVVILDHQHITVVFVGQVLAVGALVTPGLDINTLAVITSKESFIAGCEFDPQDFLFQQLHTFVVIVGEIHLIHPDHHALLLGQRGHRGVRFGLVNPGPELPVGVVEDEREVEADIEWVAVVPDAEHVVAVQAGLLAEAAHKQAGGGDRVEAGDAALVLVLALLILAVQCSGGLGLVRWSATLTRISRTVNSDSLCWVLFSLRWMRTHSVLPPQGRPEVQGWKRSGRPVPGLE